jgi:hypothetical protein
MIAALALALASAAAPPPAACRGAAEAVAFGDWLAERGDYYRAIGEFQRARWLGAGACGEDELALRIARAYVLGEQPEPAAALGRRLVREAADASVRQEAALVLALARLGADDAPSAVALSRAVRERGDGSAARRSRLVAGIALLREEGRHDEAAAEVAPLREDAELALAARSVEAAAERIGRAPRKNAALAGVLSALVPGLGHLYLGEPGTAAAAFAVNAVFLWATVDAFRAGHYGIGAAALAVESLWYGGAVFGAVAGAHRQRRDVRELALEEVEARVRRERDLLPAPPALFLRAEGTF